jgi:hypothetical protein
MPSTRNSSRPCRVEFRRLWEGRAMASLIYVLTLGSIAAIMFVAMELLG